MNELQHYQFFLVDYLPYMFLYEFVISTKMPKEVLLYDTIIIPFDNYIWSLLISLTLAEIIFLMALEFLWHNTTGKRFI
jgi:hypothetical protein